VTEERLALGTVWAKIWARGSLGQRASRKQRPFEQKESVRWREGYEQACEVARQCPQTQIIAVSDAESDIYEVLLAGAPLSASADPAAPTPQKRAECIIRAARDRRTHSTEGKLWAELLASPVLGQVSFDLPKREEREARKVTLDVHAKAVGLRAPYRCKEGQLPDLQVWAVLAVESNPPAGVQPVEWLLLSTLPVPDFAMAAQIIQWYTCRWEIEVFFKVFKVGCKVEDLQLRDFQRFKPAWALYLIIAWRILYVTMLGRTAPQMSCAGVFEEAEWKAVWVVTKRQPPPLPPPSLGDVIYLIATLGGFKGRKGDGEPGPKVMWEGLKRAFDLALAWNSFGPNGELASG
jgi:hypothetical protein